MTDEQAAQLLGLLRDYWREYGDDVPAELTVSELAHDLIDSMDDPEFTGMVPEGVEVLWAK